MKGVTMLRGGTAGPPQGKEKIINVDLDIRAEADYTDYMMSVIEDRAIISGVDGLRPVTRFVLEAAYRRGLHSRAAVIKSASVVGDTIANYHPHANEATYNAAVTAANMPMKLIDGHGNWGSMQDKPAAMRYTNLRLSRYADLIFFDPFYQPIVQRVSNYDGSRTDVPLVFPTLLPNTLLNDNLGIAPGVNTLSPAFTLKSVVELIDFVLSKASPDGKKLYQTKPQDCLHDLVFTSKYGGHAIASKQERLAFFKQGKGRIRFASSYKMDGLTLRFDRFAPSLNLDAAIAACENLAGVTSVEDVTTKDDPYLQGWAVTLKKGLSVTEQSATINRIEDIWARDQSFDVMVTDRSRTQIGESTAKPRLTSTPEMVDDWVRHRVVIERQACKYWIEDAEKRIRKLEVMILAANNADWIIKMVRSKNPKHTDQQMEQILIKRLKLTLDEAKMILDIPLKRLSALSVDGFVQTIKDTKQEIAGYRARIAKPILYIRRHVQDLFKQLTASKANGKA